MSSEAPVSPDRSTCFGDRSIQVSFCDLLLYMLLWAEWTGGTGCAGTGLEFPPASGPMTECLGEGLSGTPFNVSGQVNVSGVPPTATPTPHARAPATVLQGCAAACAGGEDDRATSDLTTCTDGSPNVGAPPRRRRRLCRRRVHFGGLAPDLLGSVSEHSCNRW